MNHSCYKICLRVWGERVGVVWSVSKYFIKISSLHTKTFKVLTLIILQRFGGSVRFSDRQMQILSLWAWQVYTVQLGQISYYKCPFQNPYFYQNRSFKHSQQTLSNLIQFSIFFAWNLWNLSKSTSEIAPALTSSLKLYNRQFYRS